MPAQLDDHGRAAFIAGQVRGHSFALQVLHLDFGLFQVFLERIVEVLQGLCPGQLPFFHLVQLVFHLGRELDVEDIPEILHQEVIDQTTQVGGKKPAFFLGDIFPLLDIVENGGVGRRAADALFFQVFDQGRLGVPGGRLGEVLLRRQIPGLSEVRPRSARAVFLPDPGFRPVFFRGFDVKGHESREEKDRSRSPEEVYFPASISTEV